MKNNVVKCNKINISNSKKFTLIAGPCQLENEQHALDVAGKLKEITQKLNINITDIEILRLHYAHTLTHWYRNCKRCR